MRVTSAHFDDGIKSVFIHALVGTFEVNSYFKLLLFFFYKKQNLLVVNYHTRIEKETGRILCPAIIGGQTECAALDCENRKSDSALPNTLFSGTYRYNGIATESLSARSTRDEGTNRGTARCDKILKSNSLKSTLKDESFVWRINHRKSLAIDILPQTSSHFFTFMILSTVSRERTKMK